MSGTVDHTMQEREEVGHNVFHRIRHEDLVAEELDLVAVDFEVVLDLREVENAREVEGVVHIEVKSRRGAHPAWDRARDRIGDSPHR